MSKKKILIILSLVAIMLVSAFGFVACTNQNNDNKSQQDVNLIAGFESYEELISFNWQNDFGRAEVSDEHVTQGSHSVKLTVRGNFRNTNKPTLTIKTATESLPKTDWLNVSSILIDVYNANDTEQTIGFKYLTKKEDNEIMSAEIVETIPAKTQKTVEFVINRDLTAYFLNLDVVSTLNLTFENATSWEQPYRVFFVDNMRYKTTDEPINQNVKVREDGELESCDLPEYTAAWGNILSYVYSRAALSFNSDPAFIKGGEGSFKLQSHYTNGLPDANRTIGINMLSSEITDWSDYYSISYWVYNDNEVPITYFWYNTYLGVLPAKEWTFVEITIDWIKANDTIRDITNILPSFRFWVGEDQMYTLYIDEICLNSVAQQDLPAPSLSVQDENSTLNLSWVRKGAASYSYKVIVDNQEEIGETNLGLTTSVSLPYGEYQNAHIVEVQVTAHGNNGESKTSSYKKALFGFDSVPSNFFVQTNQTVTVPMATASVGNISWKIDKENILSEPKKNTSVVESYENNPTTFVVGKDKAYAYKITWELELDGFKVYEYTYAFVQDTDYMSLQTEYQDLFTAATYELDAQKTDVQFIPGESSFRVYNGEPQAHGRFINNVDLGARRNYIDYFVYNASNSPVTVRVNGVDNYFDIPAKGVTRMYVMYWVLSGVTSAAEGWKVVTSDNTLHTLDVFATSNGSEPADIYIGCFRVNSDAFDFGPMEIQGSHENNQVSVWWESLAKATKYTYRVLVDGEQVKGATDIGLDTGLLYDYSQYANTFTNIRIEVTAYKGDLETTTASYIISNLKFTSVPENDKVAPNTDYTVKLPTAKNGTITWTAQEYMATVSYQVGVPAGTVLNTFSSENGDTTVRLNAGSAIKITYALTYLGETVYANTFIFEDDSTKLQLDDIDADWLDKANITTDGTTIVDSPRFDGEKALHSTSGSMIMTFDGLSLGDSSNYIEYWIYNASDSEIKISAHHGNLPFSIPAKSYVKAFPSRWGWDAAVKGWGIVDDNHNLIEMYLTATSVDNLPLDWYVFGVAVNTDAYDLGQVGVSGSVSENTLIATWKAANATNYAYEIVVNDQVIESVETTETGITYDLTNYVETMVQVEVKVTAYGKDGATSTASFVQNDLEFTSVPANAFVSAGEAYTVPTATAKKGTVTWKAELIDIAVGIESSTLNVALNTYTSDNTTQISIPTGTTYHRFFYKITYTVTVGEYTKNAYSYVFLKEDEFMGKDIMMLSDCYDDYIGSLTLSGSAEVSDFEIMPGEKTIKVTGENGSATASFVGGETLGNGTYPKTLGFWIYNPTDSDITLNWSPYLAYPYVVKAHSYLYVSSMRWDNGSYTAFHDFGMISGVYNWREYSLNATNTTGEAIEFYVGAFNVAEGDLTRK